MRIIALWAVSGVLCLSYLPQRLHAAEPDAKTLIKQAVQAVGGEDRLLKLFRTREP